jgi:phosphoserine phosphatase RsbU/P
VPTFLQRESQYRDRFFGMLGHDLRGPINAISLSAELLIKNEERSAEDLRYISRILKSCERLDHMVRDIIDFTRGRFGEPMPITRARADVGEQSLAISSMRFNALIRGSQSIALLLET